MTDEEVAQLIENEFITKTLGVTESYLEIHEAVYEEGKLKIDRIDREKQSDVIIAYLPVKDEYFSFAVYIDKQNKEIFNIGTESRNEVSLKATSNTLSSNELQAFTKLKADNTWNKGDLKASKKATYKFSCIKIIPNPEPDEFEDKLTKLLTFLEKDTAGILELTKHANTYIDITIDWHRGNQLLGNVFINLESIKKMNNLNLEINFDFTAWGEPFK